MSEPENAPAAPPEGGITRWSYDYVNQGDQLVEREDGGYVLYADHTAALAAATARADEDEAGRLRWEQEAERLRGERADLQHKLAHWQRVAEESGTMVARRVEAMREAAAMTRPPRAAGNPPNGRWGGEYQCGWDDAVIAMDAAIRALPATPAPGPSAERCVWCSAHSVRPASLFCSFDCELEAWNAHNTPAPGPSAEDAPDEMEPEEYAAYIQRTARAPGGQDVR